MGYGIRTTLLAVLKVSRGIWDTAYIKPPLHPAIFEILETNVNSTIHGKYKHWLQYFQDPAEVSVRLAAQTRDNVRAGETIMTIPPRFFQLLYDHCCRLNYILI